MPDTEKEIEALDGLLGGAKAEYRALRHTEPLKPGFRPAPRRIRARTYAIAASILLIASVLTFTDFGLFSQSRPTMSARLALAKPTMPLSMRPDHGLPKGLSLRRLNPSQGRANLTPQLPRRPTRSRS